MTMVPGTFLLSKAAQVAVRLPGRLIRDMYFCTAFLLEEVIGLQLFFVPYVRHE